jgi:hypothetical protein
MLPTAQVLLLPRRSISIFHQTPSWCRQTEIKQRQWCISAVGGGSQRRLSGKETTGRKWQNKEGSHKAATTFDGPPKDTTRMKWADKKRAQKAATTRDGQVAVYSQSLSSRCLSLPMNWGVPELCLSATTDCCSVVIYMIYSQTPMEVSFKVF